MWIYWRIDNNTFGIGYLIGTQYECVEIEKDLNDAQRKVHYLNGGNNN